MKNSTPITFPEDETFDVGEDTRTPVALLEYRYDVPFKFTGKINKLTFTLGPDEAAATPAQPPETKTKVVAANTSVIAAR